jgi:type IV pilus secretin (or competence protein) PilQ
MTWEGKATPEMTTYLIEHKQPRQTNYQCHRQSGVFGFVRSCLKTLRAQAEQACEGCTLQGRKTGVYTEVHEDFEPRSYKVMASVAVFKQLLTHAVLFLMVLSMLPGLVDAASVALEDMSFSSLPGEGVQLVFKMSGPAPQPLSFTVDNPARIALDFRGVKNQLERKSQSIGIGMARSISTAEAQGRTRVVLNLVRLVPYQTRVEGNQVILTLGSASTEATLEREATAATAAPTAERGIAGVDFRRGEAGEGLVIVSLSDPSMPVDVREEGGKIVVDFANAYLPKNLVRRLDVLDFATPIKTIDTFLMDNTVRMVITPVGNYRHIAYQSDQLLTIEVKPVTPEAKKAEEREKFGYTGERLSLNFQNIEVRSVLQLLADFTGLNIVVSDSVTGNLTLRLKNVPWDQALDIILKTRGLAMRQSGNVILVAPSEELAAREKLELEAKKQVEELSPLRSEFIQINYAKASDIAALLKARENSLMSERGNVTIDERTNTLLVLDTAEKLSDIRRLVATLDVPVRQVLIESRIVLANNDFSRDLGVRFGVTGVADNGDNGIFATTGTLAGRNRNNLSLTGSGTGSMVDDAVSNLQATGQTSPIGLPSVADRLLVDLPVINPAGSLALAILGADYLLDLELSALQAEGRGEVISTPRVITANQKEALIKQGVEVPFQEATSSGATAVSFKEANLSLKVTPQVTPDDRIIMDLTVNKDEVDFTREVLGTPPLITREVTTQVLVNNGDTVVLGGIYEETNSYQSDRVPFFADIPGLGALFRSTSDTYNKRELLIFVTPKIIKQSLAAH